MHVVTVVTGTRSGPGVLNLQQVNVPPFPRPLPEQQMKLTVSRKMMKPKNLPVHIHYYNEGLGNDGHLYFDCQCYHPRGGDPDYPVDKYHYESQTCSSTITRVNGVNYHAPWRCCKESHVGCKLPDRWTLKYIHLAIAAGMKLLMLNTISKKSKTHVSKQKRKKNK